MSRQRQRIPGIIRELSRSAADVGLVLGGSVRYGYEGPDSDLDFFGVSNARLERVLEGFALVSQEDGGGLLESRADGFAVHVAYWTRLGFDQMLCERPYMAYPILDGELVHDPRQTMGSYLERMQQYFEARPRLTAAWVTQLAALRELKTGRASRLSFPQWSDFLRHIEEARLDRPTESAAAADG